MEPSIIQQLGWVWLALPREGILPLTILEIDEKGLFKRILVKLFNQKEKASVINADIFDLFPKKGAGKVPKISNAENVSNFYGKDILNISTGFTVETLQQISEIGNTSAFSKLRIADKLLFTFDNVTRKFADNEILLQRYIEVMKPDTDSFIKRLKEGRIYIVTEVLQTTAFKVINASEFKYSGKLKADAVSQFAKLKIENETNNDRNERIFYKSETPITFALKAYKILYNMEKNNYSLFKTPLKIVRGDKTDFDVALTSDEGFVNIF